MENKNLQVEEKNDSRRAFLSSGAKAGVVLFAASAGVYLWNLLRSFGSSGFRLSAKAFQAGKPEDYVLGRVDRRWKDSHGIWIVRTFEGLYALSVKTERGCETEWFEKDQMFRCSCHKSGFYKSGVYFSGFKQKSLNRTALQVTPEGLLFVDPSRRFFQERGDWARAGSILPLVKTI